MPLEFFSLYIGLSGGCGGAGQGREGEGGVTRSYSYITYDKPKKNLFFLLDCVNFKSNSCTRELRN